MNNDLENNEELSTGATPETTTPPDQEPSPKSSQQFDPYHPYDTSKNASPPRAPEPPHSVPFGPATEPPVRVRRVGTMTMGCSLIVSGVVALLCLFFPSFDFVTVARLSPLVLIFIGLEILYYNCFHHKEKLKYDFISTFVCFSLIVVSVGVTMLSPLYEQYGPKRNAAQYRIETEIEDLCLSTLTGMPISSLSANIFLQQPIKAAQSLTYQDLISSDQVELELELVGSYADKLQFAKSCKTILDKLASTGIPYDYISFRYYTGVNNGEYWLNVHDKFRSALSADQLALVVNDNSADLARESEREALERQREEFNQEMEKLREENRATLEREREEFNQEMENQRMELEKQREEDRATLDREREELNQEMERRQRELNSQNG